jgi:hypothetical protein
LDFQTISLTGSDSRSGICPLYSGRSFYSWRGRPARRKTQKRVVEKREKKGKGKWVKSFLV